MPASSVPRPMAIVTGDLVKTGGMDRANYALADYLTRAGGRVELVAHRVAPELLERPLVTFHRVPKPFRSYMLGEPLLDLRGRAVARELEARGGVAVVNGGNCQAASINWVHYVHAAYLPPRALGRRALMRSFHGIRARAAERKALLRARLVIANSLATRRTLVETLGVAPERAFVIYYGIDGAQFVPASEEQRARARAALGWEDRPTLAFVGALGDQRKGFDTLFAAWERLSRQSSWDANLVAVGVGADVERWRARARAAGLEGRVRLLGFRNDVDRVLSACDGLASPTRYEAFGLGVAEAIAMGLPAIVSARAGVAELYPESVRHLLLDDPESVADLTAVLERWRATPLVGAPELAEFSARIRARSWDDMARDILNLADRHVG